MSTFSAIERIKSKKLLEEVYAEGKQCKNFPFRVKYLRTKFEDDALVKIAVSVPKRKVRKAVDRNKLKRQIKEAYRLNKVNLLSKIESSNEHLALFLIYDGNKDQPYAFIEEKMIGLLKILEEKL